MSIADYMTAAAELADIAGTNALKFFARDIDVTIKPDGSAVTIADRSSEQLVRDWISKRFPEDEIAGEEFGVTRAGAKRRWVIDPIDGTQAFIKRIPIWGSLVAVVEDEKVIAGAAAFPALGETLAAGLGEGCWWNGSRAHVSSVESLASATVLTTDLRPTKVTDRRGRWLELAESAGHSRTWGDCVGYLLVATGRAEVMVDPVVNDWDVAALIPAITEAGGVFTGWDGRQNKHDGGAIATNAALAKQARAILGCRELA